MCVRPALENSVWQLLHNNMPTHTVINMRSFLVKKWIAAFNSPSLFDQPVPGDFSVSQAENEFEKWPVWYHQWHSAEYDMAELNANMADKFSNSLSLYEPCNKCIPSVWAHFEEKKNKKYVALCITVLILFLSHKFFAALYILCQWDDRQMC